jgi:hypothetical protein
MATAGRAQRVFGTPSLGARTWTGAIDRQYVRCGTVSCWACHSSRLRTTAPWAVTALHYPHPLAPLPPWAVCRPPPSTRRRLASASRPVGSACLPEDAATAPRTRRTGPVVIIVNAIPTTPRPSRHVRARPPRFAFDCQPPSMRPSSLPHRIRKPDPTSSLRMPVLVLVPLPLPLPGYPSRVDALSQAPHLWTAAVITLDTLPLPFTNTTELCIRPQSAPRAARPILLQYHQLASQTWTE